MRPATRRRAANGLEAHLNSSVPRQRRTNYGVDGAARDQFFAAADVLVLALMFYDIAMIEIV